MTPTPTVNESLTTPNRRTPHASPLRDLILAGSLSSQLSTHQAALAWEAALEAFRASGLAELLAELAHAPGVLAQGAYRGDAQALADALRYQRRASSELAGAALAVLLAIQRAGTWDAATEDDRARIAAALSALARATQTYRQVREGDAVIYEGA